ncbi:MAG: RagB/SusD family nutrient uptake outer membrane protein [Bacteroidia bacterium]|nr:RagB/SusD family nutrient uptake outer membrane protein [Bacteroidia bacterium]
MKKYIILLVAACWLTACEEDLYQTPLTEKVSANFFKTETEIEEAVNGVYATLQLNGLYGLYIPAISELPSDNTFDEVPANDNGIFGQMDEFTMITGNEGVAAIWRDSYLAIQRANVVLNRIEAVSFTKAETQTARTGEMKFIRALVYFNLVRLFGDVPLVVEETVNPYDYFGKGRNARAAVYQQIEQDLVEAVAELPASATQKGRIFKTAAQTLLGTVYLTQQRYAEAKTQLDAVVGSGKHKLLDNAEDVFLTTNEYNAEIIFAVQFASGVNGNREGSGAFQQFSPSGTVSGAKGHNLPTRSFYALYGDNDLRKAAYVGATSAGVPFCKKLKLPTTAPNDGGSDWVVLRYADVLLMLAEVENELGNTPAAVPLLDQVRVRAGLSATTATTQAELREAIGLERRLELIGEGHRWFDLLRTGKAISTMNAWFAAQSIPITISDKNLLMPIPQSQVDTDPALSQNPGY